MRPQQCALPVRYPSGSASLARAGGGSSIHLQFEQFGEQHGLVTLGTTSTQPKRSAEDVARWAASIADQAFTALTTLVHGVGHEDATPSQLGTQRCVIDACQFGMAKSESQLTVSR